MPERGKEPNSVSVLTKWVDAAERDIGIAGGQLRWLIAATVVTAALQRCVDAQDRPRFRLKGGTYLRYLLDWSGRPTSDLDGVVNGDIGDFLDQVDDVLAEPWGPLQLRRSGEPEIIDTPNRVIKPRRVWVLVQLKGVTWQKVQVEISPDEGDLTHEIATVEPARLHRFGIPNVDTLFTIALRYQVAQKFHACTDPHDPPDARNDRARDVIDLVLLHQHIEANGGPSPTQIRQACQDVFAAREHEAVQLGRPPRSWPPLVRGFPHWDTDFQNAARRAGLALSLSDALDLVNTWIQQIDSAA
jgi:hypothetical protein